MDGNYLYRIFEVTKEMGLPDMTLGLARLRFEYNEPIPEGVEDREIREFIGRHNEKLVEAFRNGDREAFVAAVEMCKAEDCAKEEITGEDYS